MLDCLGQAPHPRMAWIYLRFWWVPSLLGTLPLRSCEMRNGMTHLATMCRKTRCGLRHAIGWLPTHRLFIR